MTTDSIEGRIYRSHDCIHVIALIAKPTFFPQITLMHFDCIVCHKMHFFYLDKFWFLDTPKQRKQFDSTCEFINAQVIDKTI